MTADDKKIVKDILSKELLKALDVIQKDGAKFGKEIGEKAAEATLSTIRTEIKEATGYKYGYWACECGKRQAPYYRDPRNVRQPFCHPCGKSMTWKNVT